MTHPNVETLGNEVLVALSHMTGILQSVHRDSAETVAREKDIVTVSLPATLRTSKTTDISVDVLLDRYFETIPHLIADMESYVSTDIWVKYYASVIAKELKGALESAIIAVANSIDCSRIALVTRPTEQSEVSASDRQYVISYNGIGCRVLTLVDALTEEEFIQVQILYGVVDTRGN